MFLEPSLSLAHDVVRRCRELAECTEEPGFTTRRFLSAPMREVHARLRSWMEEAGMSVHVDAAGNIRGCYASTQPAMPRLFIGSHLDTVPRAGAFDGVLGVVLAVALVELLAGRRLKFPIEVVGFSEEEGVRFGVPFIGSRALAGTVGEELLNSRDAGGVRVLDAIRAFGLDPSRIGDARVDDGALGYLEFHIEQGPVLESLDLPLGVVEAIAGQSRFEIVFEGKANHAGTTPMNLRRDALAGAAEWICKVESEARATRGLVATVGRLQVQPGAGNVIAGSALACLDVRHADDAVRKQAAASFLGCADEIGKRRGLSVSWESRLDQGSVAMDAALVEILKQSVEHSGYPVHQMVSGAGHDAMIMAGRMPAAMLFLRSPGGISHHPDESVRPEDVAAALLAGKAFLEKLQESEVS
ncbi:MAG TPA: allantoate amidohydrolase [Bryobacteraceae bacterium]